MSWYDFFKKEDKKPEQKNIRKSIASTGTEIYSGYLKEEYLGLLLDEYNRYQIFDEMVRSDSTVAMCVKAFEDTLLSSKWNYAVKEEFDEDDPLAIEQLEFMNQIFPRDKIRELLSNMVSFATHGFSVLERHYIPKYLGEKLYLCPRFKHISQRTVRQWITDEHGQLLGIYQQSNNDDPNTGFISASKLLYYAVKRRGNNFEGISLIRPCYGPWTRKNANYDNIAIGNKLLSIPFLKIYDESPPGTRELDDESINAFAKRLADRYQKDEVLMHIFFPRYHKAEEMSTSFDPQKLYQCNETEDIQIIRAFCANFLMLGGTASSSGGSYALSNNLSNFFINGIENIAKDLDAILDKKLVDKTIRVNFADTEVMIEAKHSEINKQGGELFAKAVSILLSSGGITRDEKLEDYLRSKYELPKADIESRPEENFNNMENDDAKNKKEEIPGLDDENDEDEGEEGEIADKKNDQKTVEKKIE